MTTLKLQHSMAVTDKVAVVVAVDLAHLRKAEMFFLLGVAHDLGPVLQEVVRDGYGLAGTAGVTLGGKVDGHHEGVAVVRDGDDIAADKLPLADGVGVVGVFTQTSGSHRHRVLLWSTVHQPGGTSEQHTTRVQRLRRNRKCQVASAKGKG